MLSFRKHKKILQLARLLMSLELFIVSVLPASAGLFGGSPSIKIPSPSEAAADIERRYHVNTGAVQEQGETMNVANAKKITPEVSLFFSPSDPKPGEKLTARAFPSGFMSEASNLYFTWFLMRAGCEGNLNIARCDLNGDNWADEEDYMIEAHRIIASNDLDLANVNYGVDTDNDGYFARFGGDNRVNVPNHCYYHDNTSGENYEIVDADVGEVDWGCPAGTQPICMVGSANVTPGILELSATGGTASSSSDGSGAGGGTATGGTATAEGETFNLDEANDYVSGLPYCTQSGSPACNVGTPCCVSNPATATFCSIGLTYCSRPGGVGRSNANPICRHIFPQAPGFTAGDGTYGAAEEQFWRTNPADPDTADNGNKDEANVVGLGRDTFIWNYQPGDKVGVVVEGTSMNATKYRDSSNMIMWAWSKNNCPNNGNTGSYTRNIAGYEVVIPTIAHDLRWCARWNLVDPAEGGQSTNLNLSVTASPEDPLNDVTTRGDGDQLNAVATIDNSARGIQQVYYDWRVELSPDGTANPAAGWVNITSSLNNLPGRRLLSQVRGNGVNKVQLDLNMQRTDTFNGRPFTNYLLNDIGYLRFRVDAAENFSGTGTTRRGRSDVIVKFNASQDRILAHTVTAAGDPARVSINAANEICSGIVNPADPPEQQALSRLDGKLCRVIKNEIIGLEVPGAGLSNYNWTINGQPLICNARVSATSCFDDRQGNINFFPVIGNVGDTFNITVTANQASTAGSTERTVTISRTFRIVQPSVSIVSNDMGSVWPKTLGQYLDTDGGAYTEYSKETLETMAGSTVPVRALFTPDFLANIPPPQVERSWSVDGVPYGDGTTNTIAFSANKIGQAVYNVSLTAVYRPSTLTRQAMEDIWGLSSLDTTESYFGGSTQVEQPEILNITQTGVKKYYALIASYLPGSVLFSLKVFFSVALILFASGVVFAVIPNVPEAAISRNRQSR
ncbi:MAG: hypothetical protein IPJ68_05215 [Candidatus Moraniibacteriota bacterium]|nr:MAG: hypothetical protein IPJ68_05215 [Candidatus Moranbacteria bacterium]